MTGSSKGALLNQGALPQSPSFAVKQRSSKGGSQRKAFTPLHNKQTDRNATPVASKQSAVSSTKKHLAKHTRGEKLSPKTSSKLISRYIELAKGEQHRPSSHISALALLAVNDDMSDEIVRQNGHDHIIDAISRHASDEKVVLEGARAIGMLASSADSAELILEASAVATLVKCMQQHQEGTHSEIHAESLKSLAMLAYQTDGDARVVACVNEVVKSMGLFASDREVQMEAIDLFYALASSDGYADSTDGHKSKILAADGHYSTIAAAQKFVGDSAIEGAVEQTLRELDISTDLIWRGEGHFCKQYKLESRSANTPAFPVPVFQFDRSPEKKGWAKPKPKTTSEPK
jgi:hypothetical protein